jgi:hypothetical protein
MKSLRSFCFVCWWSMLCCRVVAKKISTVFSSSLSKLIQYFLQRNAMHGTESRLVLILHRSASNAWHSAVMHRTRDSVTRFFGGLNILISTSVYALMVFKVFQKLFTTLCNYLLLWNYLLILKINTETLLRIPFSVIGRCFLVLPVSIFRVKITVLWSLKPVPGRTFKICK